jgi:hypothetical protein
LPVVVIACLVAGWWPFTFVAPVWHADNAATRTVQGAIDFPAAGLATLSLPQPVGSPTALRAVRIAITVEAHRSRHPGIGYILTWAPALGDRNFTILQKHSDLIVHSGRPGEDNKQTRNVRVRDLFAERPGPVHIELAYIDEGLRLSIDGAPRGRIAPPRANLAGWDRSFALNLGNEPGFNSPWYGTVHALEMGIDGNRLALLDTARFPPGAWHPSRRLAAWERYIIVPWPLREGSDGRTDVTMNVAGFLPFGVLLAWRQRRTGAAALAAVALASLALSLTIELGQICIIGRNPSTADLIANTLGGVLGWAIARLAGIASPRDRLSP